MAVRKICFRKRLSVAWTVRVTSKLGRPLGRSGEPAVRSLHSPTLIITVLSLSGVAVSLVQTLLMPLLPELPHLLGTTADNASWLITATLLAGTVATPTVSRLADMYGKRKMMVFALVSTAVGSLLGGVSDELPLLIAARAFQGIGLALIPVGMAIMRDQLPREKVPVGVALMSASLGIGASLGLPLSGLIVEHLGWHAIFWLTGVVCVVLVGTVLVVLPESLVRTPGEFDLRGALLLTVALTVVLLALSKGAMWGWTSSETVVLTVVGVTLLVVLAPLELRTPSPLVDVRIAARPALLLVNVVAILAGFAMLVNVLITAQLLQLPQATGYGLGLDVLETSLWMIPNAAAFGFIAPLSAWLTRRMSPQFTLLSGAVVMCLAYVGRAFLSMNLAQIVVGSVLVGVGSAMMFAALPTLVMRVVPETETASANGMNVLLRSFGTAAASAATAAISTASVIRVAGRDLPSLGALTSLFWLAAAAALGAALFGIPMLRMSEYTEEPDRSDAVARV